MNEMQFKCSECDFTFENYTHLTHMKWQVHLALGNAEYIFLGKQDSEYRNMYNFISNIQNTLKLKATKLKQGKKVL